MHRFRWIEREIHAKRERASNDELLNARFASKQKLSEMKRQLTVEIVGKQKSSDRAILLQQIVERVFWS